MGEKEVVDLGVAEKMALQTEVVVVVTVAEILHLTVMARTAEAALATTRA